MSTDWYRNVVLYALDVETFMDSNGDGIGDFAGLTGQLDYLSGLGVTCLWLQPFYPSPGYDDGYDISDHCSVDPRFGTMDDFRTFVEEASLRNIRILLDLVVNHTSVQHPWFQAARSDRSSKYRDYYVWLDRPPINERRGGLVFPGEQTDNWAYDEHSDSYYWHWFYDQQPDLNTGNPAVREEIRAIIAFWLDRGVSGFRVDAAPFLFKRKGIEGSYPDEPHTFLVELRQFLNEKRPDAVFLAEADVATKELEFFLGEGERMHLLLNFILNNYLFLALVRGDAEPLRVAMSALPPLPPGCQWANFLRNHDELNLDRLSLAEREEVFDRFAPDSMMRIYDRGIRRRLPPMVESDRRFLELAYSLLFALPGIPVLRYGQEIGMGENLSLKGRLSVRTPMQWTAGRNGGFSDAPSDRLVRPVVEDEAFSPGRLNVADQSGDPNSLLSFMKRLIRTRRQHSLIGYSSWKLLKAENPRLFAHAFAFGDVQLVCVHNLSPEPASMQLTLPPAKGQWVDVWSDSLTETRPVEEAEIRLQGYGYRWIRAGGTD